MEQFEGNISFSSELGKGSCFVFTFKLQDSGESERLLNSQDSFDNDLLDISQINAEHFGLANCVQ